MLLKKNGDPDLGDGTVVGAVGSREEERVGERERSDAARVLSELERGAASIQAKTSAQTERRKGWYRHSTYWNSVPKTVAGR